MLAWLIRILLVAAGFITSWFVATDSLNYSTIQMLIAVLLFTLIIIIIAFWRSRK